MNNDRPSARALLSRLTSSVHADHAMLQRYDAKYDSRGRHEASLPEDLVQRMGFQMMAACRVMRFFHEAGAPLGAKVVARMIRHLYGADIHWDAELADGVVIVHGMGLAVSHAARVGAGTILSQHVTLGDGIDPHTRAVGAPTLEEDVHVGAGAVLVGPITVGARSKIMPGAVLTQSVPPDSLVEVPAPRITPRKPRPAELGAVASR
jgi:serine acetyltransferase